MKRLPFVFLFSFASIVAFAQVRIQVCIIQDKELQTVGADYDTGTGDTTVVIDGKRRMFGEVYSREGIGYAAQKRWYRDSRPVQFNGFKYVKYGLPRVLGTFDIVRIGEYDGVGVYVENGTQGRPDIIYIPVRFGCEFQPYELDVPSCGTVTITPEEPKVKAGTSVTLTAEVKDAPGPLNYKWSSWDFVLTDNQKKTLTVSTSGFKGAYYFEVEVTGQNTDCLSRGLATIMVQ